ncbi:hypothetical protein WA171_007036, partial [Blastocystis sp. BT1]
MDQNRPGQVNDKEQQKQAIRAQQEANKGLSQEEKQALRKAKKMAKLAKVQEKLAAKEQKEEVVEVVPTAPIKQVNEVHLEHALTKEEIRAQQEANKNLTQEEKQALRRAKKAAKAAKVAEAQKKEVSGSSVSPKNPVPIPENIGETKITSQPNSKPLLQGQKQVPQGQKRVSQEQKRALQEQQRQPQPQEHPRPLSQQPQQSQQLLYRLFSNSIYTPVTSQSLSPSVGCFRPSATDGQIGIHPLFLQLGLLIGNRDICGANRRAEYLLLAMKELVKSIPVLPEEDSVSYQNRISTCVAMNYEYIRNVRAPSVPMERLYNEIKTTISFVCDGRNCRLETAQDIHNRVMNRLNDWGKFLESKKKSIVECLIHQIEQDDVILTFGESERITEALVGAALQKPFRQFRVVVVGGRPKQNNENMLRKLVQHHVPCTLAPLNALPFIMETTTKAIVSASAMLANGSAVADIGTAIVATTCKTYHIPLLVVADSYKFSRSVQLDSIAKNELNDSNSFRPALLPSLSISPSKEKWVLEGHEKKENLQLINLSYDLVPASLISGIVTEYSIIPATSVASVLRDMETVRSS